MKKKTLMATMALFSAMAWADGLPEGYTQLPFLKATGNCQVKTGLTPASTDTAELTFELSTVSGNQNLWCSRNDSTASFTAFMIADKVRLDRNTTQVTSTTGLAVGTKYTLTANYATGFGDVIYADSGSLVTEIADLGTGEYDPGTELCLFASHTTSVDTGLNNYGSWTFYSFSLADADNEFRSKLVPARRASDGVLGLYDTVREMFLTNGLAGTLTLGTGYSFDENGALLVDVAAQVQGSGTVSVGGGEAAAAVQTTVRQDGSTSATFTAVADEGYRFSRWILPEGASLAQGELTNTTISVSADRPVTIVAGFYSETADVCAKLVNGTFHYYADATCSPASELPPDAAPSSIAGLRVFFANDDEYQALVPFTNELATAFGGVAYLQNDLTFTADADWRAMDFNLNGKTIVLKGYDLMVRKPQGEGRVTSGNVLNPNGYSFASGSYYSGDLIYLGSADEELSAKQAFTLPKARPCYFKTQTTRLSSIYGQYITVGINALTGLMPKTSNLSGTQTWGPYVRTGLAAGTSYELQIARYNGHTRISKYATLSPCSHLCFDIPEGEEYTVTMTLGGSTPGTPDFGGVGLQVHKMGRGTLLMPRANDFGGNGIASLVVEEGLVKKESGATCGVSGSTVQVDEGAQFELCGADSSVNYDFNLAGSGPDGLGALVNNTELTGTDVPSFPVRNVTLSTNAVIGGSQPFSLKNGNWAATTTTLNGYTLTYTNATVYAGNVTYNGGNVVVPSGTEFVFEGHNSTAPSADVTINGQLVMNNGGFSTIQSLIFAEGSQLVLSDTASSGSIPTTVVTGRYAPASSCVTNGTCTLTTQPVQLGDASHLEPTLDLSRLGGVYDGTNTTFYAGSTVTVDLGELEFQGSVLLIAWTEISSATFVVDDANKDRLGLLPRPEGLYIFPGKVPSFVKYDVANDCLAFYDEDVNPYVGEWTLGMDYMKALFANDAEFQGLAQHKSELDAANVTVYLQNDITLTADADWSAIDFDMNGKSITLRGYDLKVHKPVNGRFSAGNLVDPLSPSGKGSSTSSAGGGWWNVGTASKSNALWWNFTPPKSRNIYIACKTKKYGSSTYGQYIYFSVGGTVYMNYTYTGPNASEVWRGPWAKAVAGGTQIQAMVRRNNGYSMIGFVTISPESHLTFDVPEGEIVDTSTLAFGGASTSTYEGDYGLGLEIHKTGKGTLLLNKVWTMASGTGGYPTSVVVEEGVVKKASGMVAGGQYSRIRVEDGGQFDLNGRTYHDYDYTLAGSGPDGTGALISSVAMDAATAYAQNTGTSFLRHVALSSNATVYAANNMGMIFYNYSANTMTMNGHTVTYDGVEAVDGEGNGTGVGAYRTFLGNMSYSGAGKIVVAKNGWIQPHISSPTATDTDVEVYGRFWMNSGRLTPVKSLVFKEGSLFRELNANPGVTVVNGTYGPNVLTESEGSCLKHPKVQLGDATHLNATLDLSQWTTTFDDREEGSLTFYAGTEEAPMTVALDIGERTAGLVRYAYYWKDQPPETVKFVRSENMARRGVKFTVRDDGLHFENGFTIYFR